MSFVSVVICDYFITVVADSRIVELHKSGKIHRILDEDFNKIKPLNNNVFVASTGCVDDGQAFIDNSNLYESILNEGELREKEDLERWFNNVSQYIITDYNFIIHFGGRTKNNKLKAYAIQSKTKDLRELEYTKDGIGYYLTSLENLDGNSIINTFLELCKQYDGTAESMVKVQETLNDIIADYNDSVNKKKKKFIVKR